MPCGVGDYTAKLAQALLEIDHGIQIDIVTSEDSRVAVPNHPRLAVQQVHGWGTKDIPELLRLIENWRPDVVHVQYPSKGYGMGLAPNLIPLLLRFSRLRIPVMVTLHEFSIAHPLRRLSTIFMLCCSNRIIVCDGREQVAVKRLFFFTGGKTMLFPLAPNIPVIKLHRPRLGQDSGWTLSYFGFVDKSKDFQVLVETLSALRTEGFPIRLLFIGGVSTENQERLYGIASAKGVTQGISFTGFCSPEAVSRYLAETDIALFPFRDGVSLRRASFIAAMQHGLPVVTTRAKGYLPAGLKDGENVLLVDPSDGPGFVVAVRRLLLDAHLREKLSRGALSWAAPFTWDRLAAQHQEIYREVLSEKRQVVK